MLTEKLGRCVTVCRGISKAGHKGDVDILYSAITYLETVRLDTEIEK